MRGTDTKITSEKAFSDLWERSLELRPTVVDREGEAYEVLFPGIRNQGPGPDFRGALLSHRGRTVSGDVELHMDPAGWRAHRHHTDPAYRGVVLQVVLRPRRNGGGDQAPPTAVASFRPAPGHTGTGPSALSETDIQRLGVRRFLYKSAGFRLDMNAGIDPDQVMYQAVLEAMGYARNRSPFLTLAKSVPLSLFARLRAEPVGAARFAVLSALVVGGGLIDRVERGERGQMRRVARALGVRRHLSTGDWSGFRVRPTNSPQTRIRGVARLIVNQLGTGLLRTMLSEHDRGGAAALAQEVRQRPFIGRGLAITVVASAVLPVLHAWRGLAGVASADRIVSSFVQMPAPPTDSVTRGVSTALGLRPTGRCAARHFGLHELARASAWPGHAGVSPR